MASDADPPDAQLFQNIYKFYKENNNCDFQLIAADGERISTHSFVLYTTIPKLGKSILEKCKKHAKKLKMKEIKGREMKLLIQYAYLGQCDYLEEDKEVVIDLIKAAEYLQMTGLESEMLLNLKASLDMQLSLKVLSYKQVVHLNNAVPMAENYVFRHLLDEGAPSMSFEEFSALLGDDRLHAVHEEQVWEAILKWITVDLETRTPRLLPLMDTLRMGLLAIRSIDLIFCHPLISSNDKALLKLRNALEIIQDYQTPTPFLMEQGLPLELRPRIPHISILAIGGWRVDEHLCRMAEVYDALADKWISIPTLKLDHPRGYHGLQKIDKYVYLVGGGDNEKSLPSCLKLDLTSHIWSPISPMNHARCFVSTTVLNGELYAIGGRELEQRLKSSEKYDPKTDSWKRIANTIYPHSDAAAAALDGKVYVVGGFSGNEVLNSLECYSPDTNTWMALTPMNKPRSGLTCVAHRGQLFVFGGFDGTERLRDGERYDPLTHTWSTLAPMKLARSTFQLVRVEDVLYAIGGYSVHPEAMVEAYDIIGDKWYTLGDMLEPTSALSCVAIDDLSFSEGLWNAASRTDPSCSLRNLLREYPPYHSPDSKLTLPEGSVEVHRPQFPEPLPVPWADLFLTDDFDPSEDEVDFVEFEYEELMAQALFNDSDVSTDRDDN